MSLSRHGPNRHTPDNEQDHDTSQLELQARAAYAVLIRPPPATGNTQQSSQVHDSQLSPQMYPTGSQTLGTTRYDQTPQPPARLHQPPLYGQSRPMHGTAIGGEHAQYDDRFPGLDSPGSSTDGQTVDLSLLAAEDRRKRNTEASARFRSKKKERLDAMEQSMTVLQRRAEDLEKEAVELRRENGWLKEMVIMKGKRTGQGTPQTPDKDAPLPDE
ncbi:hypothetical protein FRC17_011025 [Serendipita sp. 399]|nr:hypothetical protein FRC17_011025 [Serendipita sp. 399]